MHRRSPTIHGCLALAVVSILLVTGGCGTDRGAAPGSPVLSSEEVVWVKDLASSGVGPLAQAAKGPDREVTISGGTTAMNPAGTTLPSAATINGRAGGVVAAGRIALVFPPGAFPGTRSISLEVQDAGGYVECHLFPEGLQFQTPVQLSISLLNTTGDAQGTTIYWYDPDTDAWVDMLGAYDPLGHRVVAKLQHFSTYRTGRSGW